MLRWNKGSSTWPTGDPQKATSLSGFPLLAFAMSRAIARYCLGFRMAR